TLNVAFRETDVKKSLDGVGFVVPQKEKRLVLGCTFVHNKFEGRVPKGFLLIRAFLGGEHGAQWVTEKNETLIQAVQEELRVWLGITGSPLFTHLERHDRA